MRKLLAITCAACVVACSSATVIRSNVPAKVFVDGAYVGSTPYRLSDRKIAGSSTSVRLEAPGYQPAQLELHRSEEVDGLAIVGGLFLLVPFLWVMGYRAEHVVELEPASSTALAPVTTMFSR